MDSKTAFLYRNLGLARIVFYKRDYFWGLREEIIGHLGSLNPQGRGYFNFYDSEQEVNLKIALPAIEDIIPFEE